MQCLSAGATDQLLFQSGGFQVLVAMVIELPDDILKLVYGKPR